jgi:cob(I)alamin adenosyltransferase
MKIYTKTGDKGYTSLIGGKRVQKFDLRIESYGTIDELNSYIGLIADQDISTGYKAVLKEIQDRLFTIGSSLASDPQKIENKQTKKRVYIPDIIPGDIELLEKEIDAITAILPELRHFILPGGNTTVSFCHIARCVCRRAERSVVHLAVDSFVDEKVIVYINRLSDYLFVLARKLCFDNKIPENQWLPRV